MDCIRGNQPSSDGYEHSIRAIGRTPSPACGGGLGWGSLHIGGVYGRSRKPHLERLEENPCERARTQKEFHRRGTNSLVRVARASAERHRLPPPGADQKLHRRLRLSRGKAGVLTRLRPAFFL